MTSWNPESYESWYQTARGKWIGDTEFELLSCMLAARLGATLLDVGCGTGYFSRRFQEAGLAVTAIDPDDGMLRYARRHSRAIGFLSADALNLPFKDRSFDHCIAVTSLCFVSKPQRALAEMMRVCRKSTVLGLLNRNSMLYLQKHGHGSYASARWDSKKDIEQWANSLGFDVKVRSGIFSPSGSPTARIVENVIPPTVPLGGFLAAKLVASK